MKINRLSLIFILIVMPLFFVNCDDGDENSPNDVLGPYVKVDNPFISIDGINVENFPIMDGSDSTMPLRWIIACNLLKLNYQWIKPPMPLWTWDVLPDYEGKMTEEERYNLAIKMQHANTHGSFVNLIDGTVDLIITARSISRDEKVYAQEKGVELLESPIAKDALIFIVNPKNPIGSLSSQQIQQIYTGTIRNWSGVGGVNAEISPYIRNSNSGSQEKMETMVMEGLEMYDWPEMYVGEGMISPYLQIQLDENGIAYTPFYYYDTMVDSDETKAIAVNGIMPSKETIIDGTYPYITEVYVAVRSDIDRSSMAYKLYEALVTSGTATLETALFRVPQAVCYHTPMGKIIAFLKRHVLKVKYISLVNLIAGREIVRELVADTMTVAQMQSELHRLLADKAYRLRMLTGYDEVRAHLGKNGAPMEAAKLIYHFISSPIEQTTRNVKA